MLELNKVYNVDNLELLKQMDDEYVDLIYCDILYNTGKKFKDYDDNLGTPQQAIEWYTPRLIEMKRVLKDTGSIYLQCDWRLVHYLKVYMDELFGIKNFINEIIWYYKSPSGTTKRKLANKHDTILFYSKTFNYIINIDEFRERYSENTIKQAKNNNISFGKITKLNKNGKTGTDVWDIPTLNSQSKERVGYDTQKPKSLLERIIKASSNEGDVVADLFCGSGTSLVVAKELNRRYIGCDINPRAVDISNERLNKINIE